MKRILVVCGLLAAISVSAASAQAPEKRREFVFGVQAYDGTEYKGTFYPQHVDTLYLLAGVPNVISARETLVYYWAISNQYRADWAALNDQIEGQLEILDRGELIATYEIEDYVIQSGQDSNFRRILYSGAEARQQQERFLQLRQDYLDSLKKYTDEYLAYQEEVAGAPSEDSPRGRGSTPTLPDPPEPFSLFSTGLQQGFVVKLDRGEYTIRLKKSDGSVVPESHRKLVVFSHRREGVVYQIVPHDRWTFPERSEDPSEIVYVQPESILYLQPFLAREFPAERYQRLIEPQSLVQQNDDWTWQPVSPIESGQIQLGFPDGSTRIVQRRPYYVRQIVGSSLGYEIEDRRPTDGLDPDFWGYRISVEPNQVIAFLGLLNGDRRFAPGSVREIRVVSQASPWTIAAVSVMPALPGVTLAVRRVWALRRRSSSADRS